MSLREQVRKLYEANPEITNTDVYGFLIKANPDCNPYWLRNNAAKYINRLRNEDKRKVTTGGG